MALLEWFRSLRPPIPPAALVLRDCQYWLDGGTTVLTGTDERGRERAVMLVQNASPEDGSSGIPGRLYLDGWPVPVRSVLEGRVLAALRAAEVRCDQTDLEPAGKRAETPRGTLVVLGEDIKQMLTRGPEENIRALRDEVVEAVESERYVSFAAEVGGA